MNRANFFTNPCHRRPSPLCLSLSQDSLHRLDCFPFLLSISSFFYFSFISVYFVIPCSRLSWFLLAFDHMLISRHHLVKLSQCVNWLTDIMWPLLFRFTRLWNDTCQPPWTSSATSHISWTRCPKRWWWKQVIRSTRLDIQTFFGALRWSCHHQLSPEFFHLPRLHRPGGLVVGPTFFSTGEGCDYCIGLLAHCWYSFAFKTLEITSTLTI